MEGKKSFKVGEAPWENKPNTKSFKVGEAPWEKEDAPHDSILGIPITTIEGALDSFPAAGAIFGGALGVAGGPLTAVGGAGAGAFAGEAAANAVRSGLNLESAPKNTEEIWLKPTQEALLGASGEGAGQILGKIPAIIKKGVRSAPNIVQKASKMPDEIIHGKNFDDVGFEQTFKPNVDEIKKATERIGGKATPGMVTANQNIQNVENVLGQSPTIAGEKVRRSYQPIRKGLQESAEELAGSPTLSPYEAGEQFKTGLSKKISEKTKPLSSQFERIRGAAKNIRPSKESLNKSAQRLLKQDLAEFSNLPQGQAIQKYADMIRNAKSLDSLKQLRSSVGDEISAAYNSGNGQLAMALGKVKSSIQRLERREILKAAIDAMPTKKQGEVAAKELINDLKGVNKGWRSLMTELGAIANAGGIKKISSPKHLAKLIDDMPSEKISERFFNTKNFKGLRDVKTYLPDEFEILRQNKLGLIAEKSLTKGEPDPVKLLRNIKSVGKEARQLLFGKDGERIISDMETVINSMPLKVGASDTPRGLAWFSSILTPNQWGQEAQSAYNYMLLSGKTLAKKPVRNLKNTTKMIPRAAGYGLVTSMSKDKQKGREKWANDGIDKLSKHSKDNFFNKNREKILSNKILKKLTIEASSFTPGSKPMDRIQEKIKTKLREVK